MPPTAPPLPADATWVGVLLLLVAGLFLAALVVGLVARHIAPEAYRDTVRTDEPDDVG
jgi:hypothetical protein